MPVAVGIQSGRCPHRRDVSKNALKELPECVCNMSSLMSLYAPPEAWMRHSAAAPSERCCCRNAERNELQALPDLACSQTLLYVCVRCALLLITCRYGGEALVRGRLVSHNRLGALPGLPRTLQRLCALCRR